MRAWRRLFMSAVFCTFAAPAWSAQPPPAELPTTVRPLHYDLDLTIRPEQERYSGVASIRVRVSEPVTQIWLHGLGLNVRQVRARRVGGKDMPGAFQQRDEFGAAEVVLGSALPAGEATLIFDYDAPFTTRGINGLAKLVEGGNTYVASYMFPNLARMVFPSFDQPGYKTPFDVHVTTHRDLVVIANGPERLTQQLPNDLKRVSFATTEPLPTYLVAMNVGPFDLIDWRPIAPSAIRKRPVPLRAIAGRGKGGQLGYALENTGPILSVLESYFATPYPFAKLDLAVIPVVTGAMENAAAITYAENYFLFDQRASLVRKRSYAYVHAHEMAHQWFGNLVTPAWWDDIWLNESFATWMGNRAIGEWAPDRGFDRETLRMGLSVMDKDSRAGARPLRQPIRTSQDIAGRWNPLVYDKGSAVLGMFEGYVGAEAFRKGVRLHMSRAPYGTVTAGDFLKALGEGAGSPQIARAFGTFVDQPGVPELSVRWHCEGKELQLGLEQRRYVPLGSRVSPGSQWSLPMCISYDAGAGRAKHCSLLEKPRTTLSVGVEQCPRWVMPNAGGSGYYRISMERDALLGLVDQLDRLEPGEALALEDSLAAQMNAGRVEVADYLNAASKFAAHPAWDVSVAPLPKLSWITRYLFVGERQERMRNHIRALYEPALKRVGLRGDTPFDRARPDEAALLRDALVPFLALEMRHPSLRAELAAMGRQYVGFGAEGGIKADAVDSTLASTALAVAAQELGQPFLDHLAKLFRQSTDLVFRSDVMVALGSVTDPAQAEWIRAFLLDPDLSEDEAFLLFSRHTAVVDNLSAAWDWQKENLKVLSGRVSPYRHAELMLAGAAFCDRQRRGEVEQFFVSRTGALQDGSRGLQDTLERMDTCVAVKERQKKSASAFPL